MENMEVVTSDSEHREEVLMDSQDDDIEDDQDVEASGPGGDWSDWEQKELRVPGDGEDEADDPAFCLFCPKQFPSAEGVFAHCAEAHDFDMMGTKKTLRLDFYSCIKAVNFIRSQVLKRSCPVCSTAFPSNEALISHMQEQKHCGLPPDPSSFSNEEYLRGVLESDPVLFGMEWTDEDDAGPSEFAAVVSGEHETPAEKLATIGISQDMNVNIPLLKTESGNSSSGEDPNELAKDGSINSVEELNWKGAGFPGQEADLAREALVLRRQNAELAFQLTQLQAEIAAATLSGAPPGSFSRLSAPTTPSFSPPVPLTPASTPVHASSPRHTNPVSLGAAFGAPGVAAGLSLGIRLRQREGGTPDKAQDQPNLPPMPHLSPGMGQLHIPRNMPATAFGTPDRVPATPYQTPVMSPSPSTGYLSAAFSAAAAAAALETVAALGAGFTFPSTSETPSPGPSAAGTPRKNPRTPVSTPLAISPSPSHNQLGITPGDAQAAAALLSAWADRRGTRLGRVVESEKEIEEEEEEGEGDVPDAEDIEVEEDRLVAATALADGGAPMSKAARQALGRRAWALEAMRKVDNNYFGGYGGLVIHREMLADKVRTEAYQKVLEGNPSLIELATVMDVGCGTGILSLFSARAGAKRVIGVDASPQILAVATQVARDNGYLRQNKTEASLDSGSGGAQQQPQGAKARPVVTYVNCKIEDLTEDSAGVGEREEGIPGLKRGQVDVIVSEWMGYGLLCESMLQSVLQARDTWLKPGGAILPDIAKMYVAGFGEGGTSLPFWRDVYGFSMASVGEKVRQDVAREALVCPISGGDVITDSCLVQTIDLCTATKDSIQFNVNFELRLKGPLLSSPQGTGDSSSMEVDSKEPCSNAVGCYGVVLWFDTLFSERFCKTTPAVLSTSPFGPQTHWNQTLFTLRTPVFMASNKTVDPRQLNSLSDSGLWSTGKVKDIGTVANPAVSLECRMSVAEGSRHRDVDFSLEVTAVSAEGRKTAFPAQIFTL